jgi:hypothetical protein
MPALQGGVITFMPTQLHGYVVKEAALFWQKSVSPGSPVGADRAEMNPGTRIPNLFIIAICSRNVYNV